jgi:HEPN domain-containing protein
MQKLTREWLRKAESDLRVAGLLVAHKPPPTDEICFHCQQAVEKYLKALLQESGHRVPYTHDLEDLYDLLVPLHPVLGLQKARLGQLTQYAVDYRYPGMHAHSAHARSALSYVGRVQAVARKALGLRPKKQKRP